MARGDFTGALTAALVLPAIEGSYGLVAFAPLGPQWQTLGFVIGGFSAALASAVSGAAGGRGPMLSGSSAALALLFATLLAGLIPLQGFMAPDGRPAVVLVLAFAALGVAAAGVLQVLLAAARLAPLVRYVPYPVHAGYMNGVALVMVFAMLPHLLGMGWGAPYSLARIHPLALVVGLVGLWVAVRPPVWTRRVPPYLSGLLAATALHHVLALTPLAHLLGPRFEAPSFSFDLKVLQPVAWHLQDGLLLSVLPMLLQFAVVAALISSMQTALASSTIDELTRRRRDGDREVFAEGVANIVTGALGGLPSAGSTLKTKVALDAGASTRVSRLFFGAFLLIVLVTGLHLMNVVPMAAIAGVFVAVAITLVDAWTRRASEVLWHTGWRWRMPRKLALNYAVMLLVAGIVLYSLPLAVLVGTLLSMVLFIRSNIKAPIRQVVHADQRGSRKLRPAADAQLLQQHGQRVALLQLDGALFFGTAARADVQIEALVRAVDTIVLDFARVTEVDASGARVLLQAAAHVHNAGKRLLIAGLSPRDPRTRTLRDMDVHDRLDDTQFFPDADRALEAAEDRLLAQLRGGAAGDERVLALEETRLGAGLDAEQVAALRAVMAELCVPRGAPVFRAGDPGDSLYVSLHGTIGIWLHERDGGDDVDQSRRLVSYAPGVVFGEIGLLQGGTRSADAIAEDDAVVLQLTRQDYDRLAAQNPALLARILANMGLQLSSRVRALTEELRAEQAVR
jgi:MFS superfamily sulfate permease-like transporter/CRP-like cAMP-binding protein